MTTRASAALPDAAPARTGAADARHAGHMASLLMSLCTEGTAEARVTLGDVQEWRLWRVPILIGRRTTFSILGHVRATTGHCRRTRHPHPGMKWFRIPTFHPGRPWHIL